MAIWTYTNRVIPYNAVPTMGFGAQIATDGVSVIATWEEATEDIWTQVIEAPNLLRLQISNGRILWVDRLIL